jgi:hypothetical protein
MDAFDKLVLALLLNVYAVTLMVLAIQFLGGAN